MPWNLIWTSMVATFIQLHVQIQSNLFMIQVTEIESLLNTCNVTIPPGTLLEKSMYELVEMQILPVIISFISNHSGSTISK